MPSTTFLCDTNVLSALIRPKPDPGALKWSRDVTQIGISAVTIEEIYYGLTWKPRPRIELWFEQLLEDTCQILPVTEEIAHQAGYWRGRFQAKGDTRDPADMLIGATALVYDLTLVTQNTRHFDGCGLTLLNPFSA